MKTTTIVAAIAFAFTATAFGQQKDSSGWIALFDGKTLDGWEKKGGTADYKIEDGAIVGTTVDRSPNTFLCKGPFSDFELQFDVLCDKPLNSGVQIRSHTYEKTRRWNRRRDRFARRAKSMAINVRFRKPSWAVRTN